MLLSVGLYASGWPERIKAHPAIVFGFFALGAVLLTLGFVWPTEEKKNGTAPFGNLVGGHNSGRMISHVQHYHEASPVAATATALAQPENLSPIRLALSLDLITLAYRLEQFAWDEATQYDHDRRDAIIAWFTNPIPTKGMKGVDASQLSAHIKYSVESHWSTEISRGYWLRCSANEITINIADRAGLILGFVDWSHWVAYANPYTQPANEEFLQPALRPPGEKREMPKAEMEIDVSLLSHGTTTLESLKILLTFPSGKPYAARIL